MRFPKNPPVRDPRYLAWLRTQPCARCGLGPSEASHHPAQGHGSTGSKTSDHRAIPLCRSCHSLHHTRPLDLEWVEEQIAKYRGIPE